MKEDKDYEEEAKELSRKLYEMFKRHSDKEAASSGKTDFILFDAEGGSDVSDGSEFGPMDGFDFGDGLDDCVEETEGDDAPVYRFYLDVGMDRKLAEMFADKIAGAIVSLNAFRPLDELDGKLSLEELLKGRVKQ